MRDVLDRPEHTPEREEALLRYLGGVAYQEERKEARETEARDRAGEGDRP
jgi:hypothetical protein